MMAKLLLLVLPVAHTFLASPSFHRTKAYAMTRFVAAPSLLDNLTSLLPSQPSPASSIPTSTKTAINEAILSLERTSPTESPAESPLVNGVWTLKYSAGYPSPLKNKISLPIPGSSPGLYLVAALQKLESLNPLSSKVLSVGDVEVTINSGPNPRVTSALSLDVADGRFDVKILVKSDLDAVGESGNRLKEVYRKAAVATDGSSDSASDLVLPEFLSYNREVFITYLDDSVMIVRDSNGAPEILVRKSYGDAATGGGMAWGFNDEPDSFDLSEGGGTETPTPTPTTAASTSEEEELPAAD